MSPFMSRTMSLFVAAVALATTPLVFAAEPVVDRNAAECAAEESSQQEVAPRPHAVTLAEMFAAPAEEETIVTLEGVASGAPAMEVVVARINTDGRIVMSCVDSEKAAKKFLATPADKLPTDKQAKEQ
ncbi:MAG TPA: hypothetical protein VF215_15580 [Thermoanaerobaculia bacterium]